MSRIAAAAALIAATLAMLGSRADAPSKPNDIGVEGGSIPESLVIPAEEHNPHFRAPEGRYGFGRELAPGEIASWDIDVRFDGAGLPPGSGDVALGEGIYEEKCAACHGSFGEGEGRWPALVGGEDSLTHQGDQRPEKTVGSYWPYAPTLFDYVRRAMPYNSPQSLSADETYAAVAYILALNEIVDDDFVADAESLAAVDMPNAGSFIDDPRPDVNNALCMSDCLDPASLELVEAIKGVTPLAHMQGGQEGSMAVAASAADPASFAGKNALYDSACSVCHVNGVGGAPLLGDPVWQVRYGEAGGIDGLVTSVLQGKNAMPPRGAAPPDATDEDIAEAVRFMLEASGIAP